MSKVAVVTGAARGLGAGVAKGLAKRGWKVLLTGLEADLLQAEARGIGGHALAVPADVTNAQELRVAFDKAKETWGRIDAVVSNAGISNFDLIGASAPSLFKRVIEVNVFGTFNAMQAALPYLRESKGYFLSVASIAAATGPPGMGAYGASKAATESLCDTLRQETAHLGIEVGVAYFSWINTDLVKAGQDHPAFRFMRQQLPGPLKNIGAPGMAIRAIVRGVERRRRRVYAPWWIGPVLALRYFITGDPGRFRGAMPELERLIAEETGRVGGADKGFLSEPKG